MERVLICDYNSILGIATVQVSEWSEFDNEILEYVTDFCESTPEVENMIDKYYEKYNCDFYYLNID